MFQNFSDRLTTTLNKLRGLGRLSEENIQAALQDVRTALLEADVALPVIQDFITHVREKALGQEVVRSVRPGDALIKVVQDELTHILGDQPATLNLNAPKPLVILVVGLQGSGKTTTVAKLAHWLKEQHKKSIMLASTDVYRPAAMEQLQTLSQQVQVDYFQSTAREKPVAIAQAALKEAQKKLVDILLIDTAGRLHIDSALMDEVKAISTEVRPTETLLVVDSMMGQDAANVGKAFNAAIPLSGIILTKTDGDSRGGAALSMRMLTGKPVKFIGVGEKINALEPFHPSRAASRILGMGDIVSLVEEAQQRVSQKESKAMALKLKQGKRFDFTDFLMQLQQMKKMGGIKSLLEKLPQAAKLPKGAAALTNDRSLIQMEAIIQSMTLKERQFPALLNGSRKRRISQGSGQPIQEVNKLIKQFAQMQKTMKRMSGDKMEKQLKQLQGFNFPGHFPKGLK